MRANAAADIFKNAGKNANAVQMGHTSSSCASWFDSQQSPINTQQVEYAPVPAEEALSSSNSVKVYSPG
jgi:hypothetical protein